MGIFRMNMIISLGGIDRKNCFDADSLLFTGRGIKKARNLRAVVDNLNDVSYW